MGISNQTLKTAVAAFMGGFPGRDFAEFTEPYANLVPGLTLWGWGDREFVPPVDALSVRVNLLPAAKTVLVANSRAAGVLTFEVWAPVGSEDDADTLAAALETACLSAPRIGPILVQSATAMNGEHVDGLWRATVRVGWVVYG